MSGPEQPSSSSVPDNTASNLKETEIPKATSPASKQPAPPQSSQSSSSQKLTPEEQLALYEKELKEDDWGHQPC